MKVRLLDDADAELTSIAQWYENQRAGLGEQFISEALDAFIDIERTPRRYPIHPMRSSREVRRKGLMHFPHLVIYEVKESECLVIAIAHPSRRPGYWRNRLR